MSHSIADVSIVEYDYTGVRGSLRDCRAQYFVAVVVLIPPQIGVEPGVLSTTPVHQVPTAENAGFSEYNT